MKIKFTLILAVFMTIILFSCKKEKSDKINSIRYELESGHGTAIIMEYTNFIGGINGGELDDLEEFEWSKKGETWFYEFESPEKFNLYLSALNKNTLSDVTIRLYINDELKRSAKAYSGIKSEISYQIE